jgi:hypothetical protein
MSWIGVVWCEAGNYGPGGGFVAQQELGRPTYPSLPQPGQLIELHGQEWEVVSQHLGFIKIRPRVMKPI